MGFPRTLFLHHIVLISLVSLTIAQPDFLGNFCNYTSTSAYKTNRDTLLSSLASNTDQYGFYTSSAGKNPDTVYALVLCRGDVKLDACRECISNSVTKLKQLCRDEKEAIGWYDDCMLRYSNKSMKGIISGDPTIFVLNDKENVTSWGTYKELENMLEHLRDEAAAGGSLRKYASAGSDSQGVYALAQCTPDLSENDCSSCLGGAIDNILQCCDSRAGGRVIRPSCHFRYELTPFFAEIPGAAANSVECLSSNGNKSYVFAVGMEPVRFHYWYDYCEEKVHLIVMDSAIDQTNGLVGGFGEALKEGFVLDWRQAPSCRASEGRCGYNNVNEDFLCFCPDQFMRMNDTCKALNKNSGAAPAPLITFLPHETTCARCQSSGGFCGLDSDKFVCHCPGGTEPMTCQKPGTLPIYFIICSFQVTGRSKLALILGTVFSTVGILVILLFYIIVKKFRQGESIFFWKTKIENYRNIEAFLKNCGSLYPKRYTYSDIKKITDSFRTKLGQGGFGCVYKGQLENGRLVAVKVLKGLKGNGDEFINEVETISRTSHVHIVSFLGFCFEGLHRALVYEFMPNGSLDKFIHDGSSLTNHQLGWEALFQIVVGIARGLEYLHRGCNTRILHFDIKPHNILLNEDFCPKISDFGLAKLCPQKDSIVSLLGTRGTPGYIAPEVFSRSFGGVSHKSDVYSYGMMVLEMVGQRKNNMNVEVDHTSETYFPHWVYKRLELDEELRSDGITSEEANASVRKMIIVGLWCIQIDPSHRPSMSRVLEMLEGSLESLQIPPKPFLSSPSRAPVDSSTT